MCDDEGRSRTGGVDSVHFGMLGRTREDRIRIAAMGVVMDMDDQARPTLSPHAGGPDTPDFHPNRGRRWFDEHPQHRESCWPCTKAAIGQCSPSCDGTGKDDQWSYPDGEAEES